MIKARQRVAIYLRVSPKTTVPPSPLPRWCRAGAAVNFLRALMEGSKAPHDGRWGARLRLVFEYFLGQFAASFMQKVGEYFTPASIVSPFPSRTS